METVITRKGQVVIPKLLREKYKIRPDIRVLPKHSTKKVGIPYLNSYPYFRNHLVNLRNRSIRFFALNTCDSGGMGA